MTDRPAGQRFTHVYTNRSEAVGDSPRMRARLGSVLDDMREHEISQMAERKLGISTPWSRTQNWRQMLPTWQLGDVLDLVTIAFKHVRSQRDRYGHTKDQEAVAFRDEVREIFADENLHFEVDDSGGVHYKHDEEFARSKAASIAALQDARYANALDAFTRSMDELGKASPDGKHAIRAVFSSAEALFKLMFPDVIRLGASEADKIVPLIQKVYAADATASRAATKLLASFKDWIDAAHFYRHEQGKADEVAQPPLALAVHIVSTGAAHIRWLAEMDRDAIGSR